MLAHPNFNERTFASLKVRNCSFVGNSVYSPFTAAASGGALDFRASRIAEDSVILEILESDFIANDVASAPQMLSTQPAGGGAVFFSIAELPTVAEKRSRTVAVISECKFSHNTVRLPELHRGMGNEPLVGGALAAYLPSSRGSQSPALAILNSGFASNVVASYDALLRQHAGPCAGGAVFAQIPGAVTLINNCSLAKNSCFASAGARGGAVAVEGLLTVGRSSFSRSHAASFSMETAIGSSPSCLGGQIFSSLSVEIENSNFTHGICHVYSCGSSTGGAVYSPFSVTVYNSSFENHIAAGGSAVAGTIFGEVDLENVRVNISAALGVFFATGGSIRSFSDTKISGLSITNSGAYVGPLEDSPLCHDPEAQKRPNSGPKGGAISIGSPSALALLNITMNSTEAAFGAAFSFDDYPPESNSEFGGVVLQEAIASTAGGVFFFGNEKVPPQSLMSLCGNTTSEAILKLENCTSGRYGPICATFPFSVAYKSVPFPAVVPMGTPFDISLVLKDRFDSRIFPVELPLFISVQNRIRWTMSAENRDSVVADDDGVFRFRALEFAGNGTAAAGTLLFGSDAVGLWKNVTFQVISCLPSFQYAPPANPSSSAECHLCPRGTYRLPHTEEGECVPCLSKGIDADADADDGSCLEHHRIAEISELSHELALFGEWTVSAGYYPSPSFSNPKELLVCPNEACEGTVCTVRAPVRLPYACGSEISRQLYVDSGPRWALNCSSHGICKEGYTDRLCSRCKCDDEGCFFSSGEDDERSCDKCGRTQTALIVLAVALLQLTLVVFLLFQKSALALLLSEVVIVIILVLSGVGESWLIQLVLIMGLMFMASTLSRRRQKSPERQQDDDQPESAVQSRDDAGVSRSYHEYEHHSQARTAGVAKLVLFFVQTVATVVAPSTWPAWTRNVVHQFEALNFHLAGLECVLPSGYNQPVWKLLTQLALPWVLALNMVLAACIAGAAVKIGLVGAAQRLGSRLCRCVRRHSDGDAAPLLPASRTCSVSFKVLVRRLQFSVLFLLSASYFELSNLILAVIRPCERSFMASYPWIPCGEAKQPFVALLSLGVTFFILYTVGIPAFFGWIMFRHRKTIAAAPAFEKVHLGLGSESEVLIPPQLAENLESLDEIEGKYGFLFEAYRSRWFWWEIVWFLRRILLSVAVATLRSYDGYQLAFISITMFGFLFLHRFAKPFASQAANVMDLVTSAVILLNLSIGSHISQFSKENTTMVAVLQNLVFLSTSSVLLVLVVLLILPIFKCRCLTHRLLTD